MLTYATIFIASVFVAVVAIVFHRVITSSSKSILSSKGPVSIISSTPNPQESKAGETAASTPVHPGGYNRAAAAVWAGKSPAAPTESVDWGWKDSGKQDQVKKTPQHTTESPNTGHCSLYDVDPTAPAERDMVWPHREEKQEAGGAAYKVKR